jgi:hypothetical protein
LICLFFLIHLHISSVGEGTGTRKSFSSVSSSRQREYGDLWKVGEEIQKKNEMIN